MQLFWASVGTYTPVLIPEPGEYTVEAVALISQKSVLSALANASGIDTAVAQLISQKSTLSATVHHEPEFFGTVSLTKASSTLSSIIGGPPTSPTRIGTSIINGSAGNGSTSVTIPGGANGAIVFWSHWDGDVGATLSGFTLGGNPLTFLEQLPEGGVGSKSGVGAGVFTTLPPPGSATAAWTWSNGGSRSNGGEIIIVWIAGMNLDVPVRDTSVVAQSGGTDVSAFVLAGNDDLVLAFAESWGGTAPTLNGTVFIDNAVLNTHTYDLSQIQAANGYGTASMGGENWSSMAVVSLKSVLSEIVYATASLTSGSSSLSASVQQTSTAIRTATAAVTSNASALSANVAFTTQEPLFSGTVALTKASSTLSASIDYTAPMEPGARRVVFHLSNRFIAEGPSPGTASEIANRLTMWANDMSYIFNATTGLQLEYDPQTDCIFHEDTDPAFNYGEPPAYVPGFSETDDPNYYYGVYIGFTTESPDGGIGRRTGHSEYSAEYLAYPAIWSAQDLINDTPLPGYGFGAVYCYMRQIYVAVHELGHTIGLGVPEYYALQSLTDETGVAPIDTQQWIQPNDTYSGEYYSTRLLMGKDPMFAPAGAGTIDELKAWSRLMPVSSAFIDAFVYETIPNLYTLATKGVVGDGNAQIGGPFNIDGSTVSVTLKIVAAGSQTPINLADVVMYGMNDAYWSPHAGPYMDDQETNASGLATFNWGNLTGWNLTFTENKARLFKVYATGYQPKNVWLTCNDVWTRLMINNGYHSVVAGDYHLEDPYVVQLTPV